MNENGWGFKDFILILAIIFLALLVTVIIYQDSFNKKDATKPIEPEKEDTKSSYESYDEMEIKLKKAAERYQNNNYQGTLESKETWILSYDLLREEGYLKKALYDIQDKSSECSGYVVFSKRASNISYAPYINCKNYTTAGYDSLKQ